MKWMALVLVVAAVSGCSTVKYNNATTGDSFSYTRWGMSKIAKLDVVPTEGGGFGMTLEGFESDGSAHAVEALAGALVESNKGSE